MKSNVHRLLCSGSEKESGCFKRSNRRYSQAYYENNKIAALGVAAGHIDWTMVPYVRMSFYKHYKDGIKYIDTFASIPEFDINRSIDDNVYKRHSKAYQYALDMTTREVHQSVEGAYHNLNSLQSRSGNQLDMAG